MAPGGRYTAVMACALLLLVTWVEATSRPQVVVASSKIDSITGAMSLLFDKDTNQGGKFGPRPCSDLFVIAAVPDLSRHVCRFVSERKLLIDATVTSSWTHTTLVNFRLPSPITGKGNATATLKTAGPFSLQLDTSRQTPVPQIFGPTDLNLCGAGTYFQITADFSAGRVWKAATINVLNTEAFLIGGPPSVNLATLSFFLEKTRLGLTPRVWRFTVTLTNAFSVSSTSPVFFLTTGSLLSSNVPVVIRGTGVTRLLRSSDEIRLSAFAQIEKTCVPINAPIDWQPQFTWQIVSVNDDTVAFGAGAPIQTGPLVTNKPEIIIPPYFLRPKPNSELNYFAVRVNMTVDKFVLRGSAVIYLAMRHSLPNIVLDAPSWMPRFTKLVVDATRSCDPDYASACFPYVGQVNRTGGNFVNLVLQLGRYDYQSGFYQPLGGEYEQDNDGYWDLGGLPVGLYQLTLKVSRTQYPVEEFYVQRYFYVGFPGSGESPSCVTPNFSLPIFSASTQNTAIFPPITVQRDVPFIIRANGVGLRNALNWSVETTPPQSSRLPSVFSKFGDRPSLSVSSTVLFPGYSYTFRLNAGANCGGGMATGKVSFSVNEPPKGGVVQVSPQVGTGYTTVFTATTGSWGVSDPQSQLPLTFEFQYLRKGARAAITLASADPSPFLITRLASPKLTCRLDAGVVAKLSTVSAMLVVARDALGSSAVALTTYFTVNPLLSTGSPISVFNQDLLPLSELDLARKSGANAEDQIRLMFMLAEEAASTECLAQDRPQAEQLALAAYRKEVSRQVLFLIQVVRGIFRAANRPPSLTQFNLLVSALSSALSGAFSSFGQAELDLSVDVIGQVIQDAKDALSFNPSNVPISLDYGPIFLDALSGLAKSLRYVRDEEEGFNPLDTTRRRSLNYMFRHGHRRNLRDGDDCDYQCKAASTIQTGLRKIIAVLMTNFEPGTEPRIVRGSDVELKLSREFRTQVGDDEGVNNLDLDDGPRFKLPPDLLNDPNRIRNRPTDLPETIDICAIRYRFNPLELADAANPPPGVDLSKGIDKINVKGVVATNFSIGEVHTLLFLNQLDSEQNLDPFNLTERINITIPFPENYVAPSQTEEVACGFWDETFEGWSAEGCTVLSVNETSREILCSCNHASDFAAWNAFLANLGGGTLGVVATISIVVVSILTPALLAIWLFAFVWAANKDEEDSNAVHLGALVLLTKNRLRLHQQQRRFFALLRENAKRPANAPSMVKMQVPMADDEEDESLKASQSRGERGRLWCLSRASLLGSWLRAVYYEHSFFGIFTRFDPFYTRTQRVTVFTAVIVGNLFAASFFFDFKTANDLSPGVLIGSVIASALIVAIPVKISVRWLFRATEHTLGSPMHRVAQIYRISEFQAGNIVPAYASEAERLDGMMLFAFKDFYAARSNAMALQKLLLELDRQEAALTGSRSSLFTCWLKSLSCRNWCRTQLRGGKATVEERKRSMTARLGLKVDEKGDLNKMEVQKSLIQARAKEEEALQRLKEASEASRLEWSQVPRQPNLRVETMRKQQSAVLRFASLLYDETEPRARTRVKYLRSWFIYVAWTIILLYLLGGVAYCAHWVLARTSYKETVDSSSSQAELEADANGIIVAWLLSALIGIVIGVFLSEPVIQFIRFSLVPFVLRKFGNGTVRMWSRPHAKVAIAPNSDYDDDLGKPVVAKVVLPLATSPGVEEAKQQTTSAAAASLGRQDTATRANLVQNFKKKQTLRRDKESGNPILESLAEVVEAIA